jgi:hypothetical protein
MLSDEEKIAQRSWSSKPRVNTFPAVNKPTTATTDKWVRVMPKRTTYGMHTERSETINHEGVSIEVHKRYYRKDGACQCYGNCDCSNERGKIVDYPPMYQATELLDKTRSGGKPYKLCHSIDDALHQLRNYLTNKK